MRSSKLKWLKTNENCKGRPHQRCGLQIGALRAKKIARDFLHVLCREKGCAPTRAAFYGFPHACISHSHVSTNIPRKLGGMKSFAPFWLSRRHDERFVEPTRKIFSSYRGWGRGAEERRQ